MSENSEITPENWEFEIEEVSANVYQVNARHVTGRTISKTGTDPDKLKQEILADNKELDKNVL